MDYHGSTLFFSTTRKVYLCENPLNILLDKPIRIDPIDLSFRKINDILFSDDNLYIASDNGLTAIPYFAIQGIKTYMPIPYFQSILVNDRETDIEKDHLTLKGQNRINLVFGSKSYSDTPVIYSYMLDGVDKDWITGSATNVVYQSLSRGEYIFKVRARKSSSPWSQPLEYRITIRATIWQHPIFFIGLSILFAALVALIIIWRKNLQIKRREIDHQLVTLEQKALQSMMNPHFIFNALSSIQSYLLQKKPKEAGQYISQFARLIRQNLWAIDSLMISIEEEIDRLKNYLDLERNRMGGEFDYSIEMDESVKNKGIMIPPMIIQPFVENAILHGISAIDNGGVIRMLISLHTQDSLAIVIEDNGPGIKQAGKYPSKSEKHLNIGMTVTRKRLEIIGKKMGIRTSIETTETFPGNPNPGTRVVIVVPVGT